MIFDFIFTLAQSAPTGDLSSGSLTHIYVIASSTIAVFLAIIKAVEYFIKKDESIQQFPFANLQQMQSEACKYDHKIVIDAIERLKNRQEQHSLILNNITNNLRDISLVLKELKEDNEQHTHRKKIN